jgi:hypothetical protein
MYVEATILEKLAIKYILVRKSEHTHRHQKLIARKGRAIISEAWAPVATHATQLQCSCQGRRQGGE